MKITILGSGTSMGIPMVGCSCPVCRSPDPRDKRLRTSVFIEVDGLNILIDSGIDFRTQALRAGIKKLDAVLFTHHHADHIFGLDDLRPVNFSMNKPIRIYASTATLNHIKRIFDYVFKKQKHESDVPRIESEAISDNFFYIQNTKITAVPLRHGKLPVLGFRIGNFAYCTDVSKIPEESYPLLQNLECLILGALRHTPHPTHFTIEQAVAAAQKIKAKKTCFVHMSHEISHRHLLEILPANIYPAFDGQVIHL